MRRGCSAGHRHLKFQYPPSALFFIGDTSQDRLNAISWLAVWMTAGISVALLLPAVQAAREAARRVASMNNMKQIGLGMHNYHDNYMSFPLAGSNDPKQGVGLSWRVRVLPFVESSVLYDQFDFREPAVFPVEPVK